jgi:transposase-like protein
LEKKEGDMLPYGNGFRGSINQSYAYYRCERVSAFLIDETMLQIASNEAWLWVTIEPKHRQILGIYISRHRGMIIAERGIYFSVH